MADTTPNRAKALYDAVQPGDLGVPLDWVPLTGIAQDPPSGKFFRGIRAITAGSVICVTASGVARTLPFLAGETRWCVIASITSASLTGEAAI